MTENVNTITLTRKQFEKTIMKHSIQLGIIFWVIGFSGGFLIAKIWYS